MKKFLLSLVCAFVALGMNAAEVVDLYKDFTTAQNISWGSDAANARISFSATDGLVYSSTVATANNWDAQYWIANGNAFKPENTYTLTMMIKGSVEGVIGNIKLGDWGQGVDNYNRVNIPTGDFQEVSIEVSGVTGGDGILVQTGSYVGDLCIKWVKITHEDSRDASKFYLALTDIPAGANAWDHQLQYPFDPALPAGDYTLSLDIKGDAAGSMSIWGDYVEGANYGPGFDFGTSWETKTVDFNLSKDYKQFALVFGQYTGSSISFDNIKITSKATGEDVVSADFASGTLEGFKVSGFWTNDGGWVQHTATSAIVEDAGEDSNPEGWVCPADETDLTTLAWTNIGQDCADNLGSLTDASVYGTDAGPSGDNLSYFDISAYGHIKVYGPAGQRVRFFINRAEYPSNFQFYADINENGEGVLDLLSVYTSQRCDYIHLNGVKASAYGQKVQVDHITVFGEPEKPWVCPEGEIDVTTLQWVKNANNCENRLGSMTDATVYGTDAGPGATPLSYIDITNYEAIKVYGPAGQRARFFINRDEFPGNFQFYADINDEGVGVLDLATVLASQEGAEYIHLNGIKAASWGQSLRVDGVTVIEKPAPYTIATTAGKIGTVVLDYPASVEGATLYEVVSFDATAGLALAEVEGDMVGGTPYIYVAQDDEIVCTKKGASVAHGDFDCTKGEVGNGLVGCYSEVSPATASDWFQYIRSSYVISNNKLRQISNGNVTIPANRCFFDPSKCTNKDAASVKMTIAPAEDATAISNVNAALEDGKIYDMNGREVKSMKKGGIYVVGGMKVSVK